MDIFKNNDLKRILSNESVRKELINQTLSDVKITKKIVEDLGDKMSDFLEDDRSFKQKFLSVAMGKPECRRKIIKEIVKEFRD